jgi:S1-C subfamily serine protease
MQKTFARTLVAGTILVTAALVPSTAQNPPGNQRENEVPASTQWLLDAAGATHQTAIKSVYLLVCPKTNSKGTAFLIKSGILVTDNHVVQGCQDKELEATSPMGKKVKFSKLVTDPDRDLALLRPSETLTGGLELGTDISPPGETPVKTWGFPLIYNGPAPLLSIGYVAGYNDAGSGNRTVKHIVVNGAFNPGNSGGPLLASRDDKVVGVVVWKMRVLPQWVGTFISNLSTGATATGRICCAMTLTMPDGTRRGLSSDEATAAVLDEFYRTVQVMIGEATSVSELKAFLREKENDLR